MNERDATEKVQDILVGIDGGWHDGQEIWVSARRGGIGSTSCSIELVVSDVDSVEYTYIVEARLVEDD